MPWDFFLDAEEDIRFSSLQENGDEGDDGSLIAISLLLFRTALLFLWFFILFFFRECFGRLRGDLGGGDGGGELIEREAVMKE